MALDADARRPKRGRRTGLMLFEAIQEQGYTGCCSGVTDFIRKWRNGPVAVSGKPAFVPSGSGWAKPSSLAGARRKNAPAFSAFATSPWLEALAIGGSHRKIQAAHTKLCASRAFMTAAYPGQGHEMPFDARTRAFTALGGAAKRGISATAPALPHLLHPCSRTAT
jgi:hypothetical protein